jgi:hypothetical protein
MKRAAEQRSKQVEIIENENVNLLAEVRTLKEEREDLMKKYNEEIKKYSVDYLQMKKEKEEHLEKLDFCQNELRLVKDVNMTFRQENNRLLS